ncbi:hypothetical protein PAECIP111893_04945 [Paenibacillus plantiphilus]|uniref:Uncharacterized protein n=1 Tax=Paenibacillus plantiphilus TaxID=2905650 RepID=A0ABM9CSP6_9BACL|nr:hypothetical protein [Paenibacillus plantiphilus]CAH1223282.1 hypothetical protein PAECIP111893_04945 [Paenibacillus plantiphilus]
MFEIKSYLKRPQSTITDLNDVVNFPERYFIEITDSLALKSVVEEWDYFYLDGAISMKYYDEKLMDFRLWDLIDQLWAYFLNVITEFIKKGEGSTYFPDQPVELMLKKVSNHSLEFTITGSKSMEVILPKDDFLIALLDGAEQFFTCMSDTFSSDCDYSNELMEIENLRASIV